MKRFAQFAALGAVLLSLPAFADWNSPRRGGWRHHHGHWGSNRANSQYQLTRSYEVPQQNSGQYVMQTVQRWVEGGYVSVWVRGRAVSRWQPGHYENQQEWVWVPAPCNGGW